MTISIQYQPTSTMVMDEDSLELVCTHDVLTNNTNDEDVCVGCGTVLELDTTPDENYLADSRGDEF